MDLLSQLIIQVWGFNKIVALLESPSNEDQGILGSVLCFVALCFWMKWGSISWAFLQQEPYHLSSISGPFIFGNSHVGSVLKGHI